MQNLNSFFERIRKKKKPMDFTILTSTSSYLYYYEKSADTVKKSNFDCLGNIEKNLKIIG